MVGMMVIGEDWEGGLEDSRVGGGVNGCAIEGSRLGRGRDRKQMK